MNTQTATLENGGVTRKGAALKIRHRLVHRVVMWLDLLFTTGLNSTYSNFHLLQVIVH